ncbi:hypothetical protein ABFS82_04G134600 [Erythranthe guttata]|uniref:uncharacterized protein LOC105954908 n=1 Tax=Erythranthe guttata TaxID=4155 RepID=UPI00064DA9E8|nr:PREDICTED: uncharacterized protein LOC105954908 [Erythranthe guttata]|eukprot:XP_012834046.1 PREDICTED: uncharacterized protein LOC105954908 [Erythranthe guttata]
MSQEFSDTDSDDGFNEDMEALRRACQIAGKNPADDQIQPPSTTGAATAIGVGESTSSESESDCEGDDDLQMVRSIQKRFAPSMDTEDEPPTMEPLCTLPADWSDSDDCGEDYETLRAIQRRFAAYNEGSPKDNTEDFLHRTVQVGDTIIDSEKESSNSFVERTNAREGFLNCVDTKDPTEKESEASHDAHTRQPSDDVAKSPLKNSDFPKSALAFVDAIKKNRSCQKLIRTKMMQMESRIEELNKMKERVKILKDFQVACKKRTGRSLSQKKDARVQLISLPKLRANMKFNEKISAQYKGPPENMHVANYKEALKTFAVSVSREKWSKEESENLVKGVKQQFQGMLLQRSVDLLSEEDGSCDVSNVDSIIGSIKDVDITPEKIRLFLPKVNWEQLAGMYVPGRSGAECRSRFLNFEDPLINHNQWTAMEDKNLLYIVQQKGVSNWIDIAASLGTNRTPFQCLARYQRSLNASILKREWTNEEDNHLRAAVETYGESNWQDVASVMEGRTGTQCSNRWLKTLHPTRERCGKWTAQEDKRLKVAVTFFGPKTWKKVARYVPGRTQVQCRERWVNCLDPSLKMAKWTEEEDSKLKEAISKHVFCWSKVASCVPGRTDNQCLRRCKVLFPGEFRRLQAAKKIQKVALISNFVDRESERPTLGPNDFRLPETYRITESEDADPSRRKKRRTRSRQTETHESIEKDALSGDTCPEEVSRLTNGNVVENLHGRRMPRKAKSKNSRLMEKNPCSSSYSHRDTMLGEEVMNSRPNDGKSNRKHQQQKKKSRVKSKPVEGDPTTSGAVCEGNILIEPDHNENKCTDPTEECLLPTIADPNLQWVNVGTEPNCDDSTQSKKAKKLQPRRCRGKMLVEEPEATQAGDATFFEKGKEMEKKKKKKKKKRTDETNNYLTHFPDSMSLADIMKELQALRGIKARKRKCVDLTPPAHMQTKTTVHTDACLKNLGDESSLCHVEINQCFSSDGGVAVLGNSEDSAAASSVRDNIILSEIEKEKENWQLQIGSSIDASVSNQSKKSTREETCSTETVEVEAGSRSNDQDCPNQAAYFDITPPLQTYFRKKQKVSDNVDKAFP